ncbi:D-Ala-D-Ala carboxypeptidase family metallohydrolase [Pseudoalteromonas shioyasakiensis]|uniref:D-Ala-D-Ala carboxypeptidase family metallohydrolase n=1 Tax=Pseudoalteromonas shioyasakiensis TaxID=1190813 RepID=UPI0021173E58|nr:D-Ala-D-Ala carboxypeptidase family metallohydrolase [Pseudoalteromonas shioyasakiensis]MCQ8882684.1 D-Ala-D-Ala carboxypeptidase family metallohydrolase [Pseudoalteromonas shioyasakiensis]
MYFSRIILSVFLALTTCSVAAIELSDSLHSIVLDAKQVLTLDNTADFAPTTVSDVETERLGPNSIAIYAPENAGFYNLVLSNDETSKHLLVIVKKPFNANNKQLNNYQIGLYPTPYKGYTQYSAPNGFIEIFEKDLSRQLTPHVQVKNIICKQVSGFPKYLYVNNGGLMMLEELLKFVQSEGIKVSKFAFISGYRTPHYNRSIGNGKHSRHQYGDAFDLYIDEDSDGRMDDLNGDGKLTVADVDVLYKVFEKFQKQSRYNGGIGRYRPASHHGGFVHIDNRGFTARW